MVVQLCYRAVAGNFDQQAVAQTGLCSLLGTSREDTRRPKGTRFDPNGDFSGTWLQRLPGQLHLQLVVWAQNERVTINLLVNYILVRELERRRDQVGASARAHEAA